MRPTATDQLQLQWQLQQQPGDIATVTAVAIDPFWWCTLTPLSTSSLSPAAKTRRARAFPVIDQLSNDAPAVTSGQICTAPCWCCCRGEPNQWRKPTKFSNLLRRRLRRLQVHVGVIPNLPPQVWMPCFTKVVRSGPIGITQRWQQDQAMRERERERPY